MIPDLTAYCKHLRVSIFSFRYEPEAGVISTRLLCELTRLKESKFKVFFKVVGQA
jgi:hypothetical protein